MKKSLIAGNLLVMARGALAQNNNQEMRQMLIEAGVQDLRSALRQTLHENSADAKPGLDDRKNLVNCAYFDEQLARISPARFFSL